MDSLSKNTEETRRWARTDRQAPPAEAPPKPASEEEAAERSRESDRLSRQFDHAPRPSESDDRDSPPAS